MVGEVSPRVEIMECKKLGTMFTVHAHAMPKRSADASRYVVMLVHALW